MSLDDAARQMRIDLKSLINAESWVHVLPFQLSPPGPTKQEVK